MQDTKGRNSTDKKYQGGERAHTPPSQLTIAPEFQTPKKRRLTSDSVQPQTTRYKLSSKCIAIVARKMTAVPDVTQSPWNNIIRKIKKSIKEGSIFKLAFIGAGAATVNTIVAIKSELLKNYSEPDIISALKIEIISPDSRILGGNTELCTRRFHEYLEGLLQNGAMQTLLKHSRIYNDILRICGVDFTNFTTFQETTYLLAEDARNFLRKNMTNLMFVCELLKREIDIDPKFFLNNGVVHKERFFTNLEGLAGAISKHILNERYVTMHQALVVNNTETKSWALQGKDKVSAEKALAESHYCILAAGPANLELAPELRETYAVRTKYAYIIKFKDKAGETFRKESRFLLSSISGTSRNTTETKGFYVTIENSRFAVERSERYLKDKDIVLKKELLEFVVCEHIKRNDLGNPENALGGPATDQSVSKSTSRAERHRSTPTIAETDRLKELLNNIDIEGSIIRRVQQVVNNDYHCSLHELFYCKQIEMRDIEHVNKPARSTHICEYYLDRVRKSLFTEIEFSHSERSAFSEPGSKSFFVVQKKINRSNPSNKFTR